MALQIIPVASASKLEKEALKKNEKKQQKPIIVGLSSHVRKRWEVMRDHKKQDIEERLTKTARARNMEYSAAKMAEIKAQGGSEIFMGIVSTKCRTATAWLRDTLLGTGGDKPWSISATPVPDVPPDIITKLQGIMQQNLMQFYAQGGDAVDPSNLKQLASGMKDTAMREMKHEAEKRVDRMEKKMEDQLIEGGFVKALFEFTNDIATYPFATLKGPVPRKRKVLEWAEGGLAPTETVRDEWERVDPYKFYWAPWGDDIQNMPVIEVHHLTREDVEGMIGVEGYDEDAIRSLLSDFGVGGFDWLEKDDTEMEDLEGKDFDEAASDLVAAIQLWDSIPGHLLIEWGLKEKEIDDPQRSYPCEVWMVNNVVI